MGKQAKVQAYMEALLKNPKFFEWAAKRYGQLQSSGEGLVCDVAVGPLAKAVSALEEQLTQQLSEDEKAN